MSDSKGLWSDATPEHVAIDLTDASPAIFNLYADIRCLKGRIAELEKVADAAAILVNVNRKTNHYKLADALRAAGYLGGGE